MRTFGRNFWAASSVLLLALALAHGQIGLVRDGMLVSSAGAGRSVSCRVSPTVETWCIYSNSAYNAFPGIIAAGDGTYLIGFREAPTHTSGGVWRVIRSASLSNNWTSIAAGFLPPNDDVRDVSMTRRCTDNALMLVVRQYILGVGRSTGTVTYSTNCGTNWSSQIYLEGITNSNAVYHATLHQGTNYFFCYNADEASLWYSVDGTNCSLSGTIAPAPFWQGESAIGFVGNVATGVVRQYYGTNALLVTSSYPFSTWTTNDLGYLWQGPNVLVTNGSIWTVGRHYRYGGDVFDVVTAFAKLDVGLQVVAGLLPTDATAADAGYGDAIYANGSYWVAYYAPKAGGGGVDLYIAKVTYP